MLGFKKIHLIIFINLLFLASIIFGIYKLATGKKNTFISNEKDKNFEKMNFNFLNKNENSNSNVSNILQTYPQQFRGTNKQFNLPTGYKPIIIM